ncbi:MAG: hypothetical protein RJB65_925 [Actinomycetota bacterium]
MDLQAFPETFRYWGVPESGDVQQYYIERTVASQK